VDFTLNKYEKLCQTAAVSKYTSITIADYLQLDQGIINRPYIVMRHDIDRSPQRALDTARVEHKYGISSTYYFRTQRGTYIPDIIDEIASLGHEIGYHYETLDKCKGNLKSAQALFQKELTAFKKRYTVKTVCAHGNPLTRNDNKDIWKSMEFSDFGLLGEAFLSIDFDRFAYFSDSGRTWLNSKSQKLPGKDSVETAFNQVQPKRTDDVIEIIKQGKLPNICVLTHPERWCKDVIGFSSRYLLDTAFSWGKVAIYAFRRISSQYE
jgi:hypothetical protein